MEVLDQAPFFTGDITRIIRPDEQKRQNRQYESLSHPEVFIRSSNLDSYEFSFVSEHMNWSETGNDGETIHDLLSTARGLFTELDQTYGISTPGFSPFIGKNEDGQTVGYILAHRVHGSPISPEHIQENPNSPDPQQLDDLGEAVANYYFDKFLDNSLCIVDIRPLNIMYGNTVADDKSKFYLVDVDPIYSSIGEMGRSYTLKQVIGEWCEFIKSLGQGGNKSRATFNSLLDKFAEEDRFSREMSEWREKLEP